MLLGHRIRQQSILWPLVAVMLPGWLLLVSLVRRPNSDMHTQLALHDRAGRQMLAYEEAPSRDPESLGERRENIETLYRQAAEANLVKESQLLDQALIWERFGEHDRALAIIAKVEPPKIPSPYLALAQKTLRNEPWNEDDKTSFSALLTRSPADWWLQFMARQQQIEGYPNAELKRAQVWAFWYLKAIDRLLPTLAVLGLLLAWPALKILRGTWTIWPYSERLQHLWPVALMLFALSLRGLFLLLGNKVGNIILPLIAAAGQRDLLTVYHIQSTLSFIFNILVLVATTYGVKEIVAWRWGTLGEVLGLDRQDLLKPRIWLLALPCAIALHYGLAPLPGLLNHWQIGGTSIYDGLSRSPAGHNTLGTVLSLVQAIAIAPLFEEIIYRGFLLAALRNYGGQLFGIVTSSLIFALAHGASFTGTVTAFVYGLAYAGIKLHTGRLSVPIALHACVAMIQMALIA